MRPSAASQSRPSAPSASGEAASWGSEPAGSRPFVNVMRADTPSTGGALTASWMARSSGLGSGFSEPSSAAWANPAVSASATVAARSIRSRVVDAVLRNLMGRQVLLRW